MANHPDNEPILGFAPGSDERVMLQAEMDRQISEVVEIPCIINGEEVFTGVTVPQVIPNNHGHVLANVHLAGREEMEAACAAAVAVAVAVEPAAAAAAVAPVVASPPPPPAASAVASAPRPRRARRRRCRPRRRRAARRASA